MSDSDDGAKSEADQNESQDANSLAGSQVDDDSEEEAPAEEGAGSDARDAADPDAVKEETLKAHRVKQLSAAEHAKIVKDRADRKAEAEANAVAEKERERQEQIEAERARIEALQCVIETQQMGREDELAMRWELRRRMRCLVISFNDEYQTHRRERQRRDAEELESLKEEGFQYQLSKLTGFLRWSDSPNLLRNFEGHTGPIFGCCLASNGRTLATASADKTVRLWWTTEQRGDCIGVFRGHKRWVKSVAMHPELDDQGLPRKLVSCSIDNTVKIWRVESRKCLRTLRGHTDLVYSAEFSHDGKFVISSSQDQTIRLWKATSGQLLYIYRGHVDAVSVARFSSSDRFVVSCGGYSDRDVIVWRTHAYEDENEVDPVKHTTDLLLAQRAKEDMAAQMRAAGIKLFHDAEADAALTHQAAEAKANLIHDNDGRQYAPGYLFTCGNVNPAQVAVPKHIDCVNSVFFSPNEHLIASGASDFTAKLWSAATGELLATIKGHDEGVLSVAFTADSACLVTSSADLSIRVWQVDQHGAPLTRQLERKIVDQQKATRAQQIRDVSTNQVAAMTTARPPGSRTTAPHEPVRQSVAGAHGNNKAEVASGSNLLGVAPVDTGDTAGSGSEEAVDPLTEGVVSTVNTLSSVDTALEGAGTTVPVQANLDQENGGGDRQGARDLAESSVVEMTASVEASVTSAGHQPQDANVPSAGENAPDFGEHHKVVDDSTTYPKIDLGWSPPIEVQLLVTMRGHVDVVHTVVCGSSGEHILSCSHDMTAKLWQMFPKRPSKPGRPTIDKTLMSDNVVEQIHLDNLVAVTIEQAGRASIGVVTAHDVVFPTVEDGLADSLVGGRADNVAVQQTEMSVSATDQLDLSSVYDMILSRADGRFKVPSLPQDLVAKAPPIQRASQPDPRSFAGTVQLSWVTPFQNGSAIEHYYIQARQNGGAFINVGRVGPVNQAWVCGVRPGAELEFRIAAENAIGMSDVSAPSLVAAVPPNVPHVPAPPYVSNVESTEMTVRWEWQLKDSLGSDISHFLIQARGDIFKNWSDSPVLMVDYREALRQGIAAEQDSGLAAATEMLLDAVFKDPVRDAHRRSRLNKQRSAWKDNDKRRRQIALADGDVSASKHQDDDAKVVTTTTAEHSEDYFLQGKRRGRRPMAFRVWDLEPGRQYQFRIAAVNSEGQSRYSFASFSTPTTAVIPGRMVRPRVSNVTTDALALEWAEPKTNGAPVTLFHILQVTLGPDNDPSWKAREVEKQAANAASQPSGALPLCDGLRPIIHVVHRTCKAAVITNLEPGWNYRFGIRAVNLSGVGICSLFTDVVLTRKQPPQAPEMPVITSTTYNSVTLRWVAPTLAFGSTIHSYELLWRISGANYECGDRGSRITIPVTALTLISGKWRPCDGRTFIKKQRQGKLRGMMAALNLRGSSAAKPPLIGGAARAIAGDPTPQDSEHAITSLGTEQLLGAAVEAEEPTSTRALQSTVSVPTDSAAELPMMRKSGSLMVPQKAAEAEGHDAQLRLGLSTIDMKDIVARVAENPEADLPRGVVMVKSGSVEVPTVAAPEPEQPQSSPTKTPNPRSIPQITRTKVRKLANAPPVLEGTAAGLDAGTPYEFRIVALSDLGQSKPGPMSNEVFTDPALPPDAPADAPRILGYSPVHVRIGWTPAQEHGSEVFCYRVAWCREVLKHYDLRLDVEEIPNDDGDEPEQPVATGAAMTVWRNFGDFDTFTDSFDTIACSLRCTDLEREIGYKFRVKAISFDGESDWSPVSAPVFMPSEFDFKQACAAAKLKDSVTGALTGRASDGASSTASTARLTTARQPSARQVTGRFLSTGRVSTARSDAIDELPGSVVCARGTKLREELQQQQAQQSTRRNSALRSPAVVALSSDM